MRRKIADERIRAANEGLSYALLLRRAQKLAVQSSDQAEAAASGAPSGATATAAAESGAAEQRQAPSS